ncbi:hypothetical protein [Methanoregula sp.]|uniref:hypothetical protein n=1 Tax=Methanoregula sp. TaxID=2052170 RepID=UPI002C52BA43|nr:hypothetical protein [Methanoregula sp.]HVP95898.1 hypothetical protein [Methanoregula sp.]
MNTQVIKNGPGVHGQALNEMEIILGGIVWFAVLLAGFTTLTVVGGCLYLAFLGSRMYF